MAETGNREFFRVHSELQIRFRKIESDELQMFQEFGLRPSPYASLRMNLEADLQRLGIRDESKLLLEKAFQILLNIDQRLERIEEFLQAQKSDSAVIQESHEWLQADVSAGGLAFTPNKDKALKMGDVVMMDIIFPSLPEQRVVCTGKVVHLQPNGFTGIDFLDIHRDDQEFIHRFVVEKERENLRARAFERDQKK